MTLSTDLEDFTDSQTANAKTRLDQTASKLKDTAGLMQARLGDFAEEAKSYALTAVAIVGVAIVAVAFVIGRRRGRRHRTIVEVRRF